MHEKELDNFVYIKRKGKIMISGNLSGINIEKILKSSDQIQVYDWQVGEEEEFTRTISFTIFNENYKIVWHRDYCVLMHNDIEIIFDDMDIATKYSMGTMQRQYLQFYLRGYSCASIPLDDLNQIKAKV